MASTIQWAIAEIAGVTRNTRYVITTAMARNPAKRTTLLDTRARHQLTVLLNRVVIIPPFFFLVLVIVDEDR